jgi:REP element-mobilizing transposase RayT
VVDGWHRFDGRRYDLVAWVVMPNHVHVLMKTRGEVPLSRVVQSWKSYTARLIGGWLVTCSGEPRLLGLNEGAAPRPERIWMPGYWDRFIRDDRHLSAVVEYIHNNPVKAGLVRDPGAWPWSSAREWERRQAARVPTWPLDL